MKENTLQDQELLLEGLRDLYDAENRLVNSASQAR